MAQQNNSRNTEEEESFTPPAPLVGTSADSLLKDAERRRDLERDLTKMGMSAGEIRQLLNANSATSEATELLKVPKPAPSPLKSAPMPSLAAPQSKKRTSAEDLQIFAAEMMAKKTEAKVARVEIAMKDLPAFRESTVQERRDAETLLRDASLLRRRERFSEAEEKCRQALALSPQDSAALEFLGDVLQGVARTDEALAAYKRAIEADPKRSSAEAKYANLLTLQENYQTYDPEEVGRNPWVATLLSGGFPGIGQIYNGETTKGLVFFGLLAACYFYSNMPHAPVHKGRMDWNQIMLLIIVGVIWVVSMADASSTAKRQRSNPRW
ncbi:hypothetical protein LBMAG21_14300 [Armatimonadota bacterium]|nr:hypothetical protein LBMAG21_14300 [Armatimonadota bacterium]